MSASSIVSFFARGNHSKHLLIGWDRTWLSTISGSQVYSYFGRAGRKFFIPQKRRRKCVVSIISGCRIKAKVTHTPSIVLYALPFLIKALRKESTRGGWGVNKGTPFLTQWSHQLFRYPLYVDSVELRTVDSITSRASDGTAWAVEAFRISSLPLGKGSDREGAAFYQ